MSASRPKPRLSTAVVAGFALFLIVIGLITGGPGGAIMMAAAFALVTGLYTFLTNRPSWARLTGRRAGAITAGAGVVALLIGGAISPTAGPVPNAAAEQTQDAAPESTTTAGPAATPSPEPSPAQSTTPSSAPTPSSTADSSTAPTDVAPLDDDGLATVTDVPDAPSEQPAANTTALALLETLPVKGRAPKTGYDREQFGQAWLDVDHNGCDTRNDMLNRDLTGVVHTNAGLCKVQSGTLADPYTGTVIAFLRGQTTSTRVQIDHVVALSDAWQKGAQQLTGGQRVAFANDPLNLQSTDGPTNQQKSDGDAATWLPPNKGYRCEYVARQVSVKATYTLWVTQAEHDAMALVLSDCSGILAPTDRVTPADQVAPPVAPSPEPVTPEAPEPVAPVPAPEAPVVPEPVAPAPVVPAPEAPAAPAAPAPYYANCDAVRAAGAAPISAGTPGFQPKFDRDGDGVGCDA